MGQVRGRPRLTSIDLVHCIDSKIYCFKYIKSESQQHGGVPFADENGVSAKKKMFPASYDFDGFYLRVQP